MRYDDEYERAYDQAIDFSEAPAEAFVRKVFDALGISVSTIGAEAFDELFRKTTNEVSSSMNAAVAEAVADELAGD